MHETEVGDAALLTQAGTGDQRAFNALVLRHSGFVHTLALRYTQNRSDAEEIAQSVFLTLWRHAAQWQPTAQLRTWLYRVTVNRCIDRARRTRRWQWVRGAPVLDAVTDEAATGAQRAEDASDLARVRLAMARLAPRQRMALTLVAEEELSGAEAAAAMDISPGALEQLLVRARKRLRMILEEDDDR